MKLEEIFGAEHLLRLVSQQSCSRLSVSVSYMSHMSYSRPRSQLIPTEISLATRMNP